MRLGVGCPCPPVRNDIVTPRHLLFLFFQIDGALTKKCSFFSFCFFFSFFQLISYHPQNKVRGYSHLHTMIFNWMREEEKKIELHSRFIYMLVCVHGNPCQHQQFSIHFHAQRIDEKNCLIFTDIKEGVESGVVVLLDAVC